MHALFFGHETEHGEDSKTSINTSATVENRQYGTVPVHLQNTLSSKKQLYKVQFIRVVTAEYRLIGLTSVVQLTEAAILVYIFKVACYFCRSRVS